MEEASVISDVPESNEPKIEKSNIAESESSSSNNKVNSKKRKLNEEGDAVSDSTNIDNKRDSDETVKLSENKKVEGEESEKLFLLAFLVSEPGVKDVDFFLDQLNEFTSTDLFNCFLSNNKLILAFTDIAEVEAVKKNGIKGAVLIETRTHKESNLYGSHFTVSTTLDREKALIGLKDIFPELRNASINAVSVDEEKKKMIIRWDTTNKDTWLKILRSTSTKNVPNYGRIFCNEPDLFFWDNNIKKVIYSGITPKKVKPAIMVNMFNKLDFIKDRVIEVIPFKKKALNQYLNSGVIFVDSKEVTCPTNEIEVGKYKVKFSIYNKKNKLSDE